MDEQLKKVLRDMQEKENSRKSVTDKIETEIESIKTKQETEEERFAGKRDKDGKWLKEGGIYDDINAGLYNNITEGQMQKIIDEELQKIKHKYDIQRAEVNKKLEETKKQDEEEKASDYKEISSAIKDYHLEMVLAVNKANKELTEIEAERDAKIEEVDKKIAEKQAERNAKIQEIDKQIAEKEAAQTHLIMQNRNFMDIEASRPSGDIKALGEAIERLKYQKETMSSEEIDQLNVEKNSITNEYALKLKAQSDRVQYYSQQKERAGKFFSSIILSEKTVDEIYEILFDKEKEINQETGKPAEGKPVEGKPVEGKPAEEKPAEGKPAEGKPAEGKPVEGKPVEGKPAEEKPAEGKPAEGKPAEGKPAAGKPVEGKQEQKENTKLDIEVSAKGISINGELMDSNKISGAQYTKEMEEFFDKTIKEYNKNKKYDEKIIKAIVLGGCKRLEEGAEFTLTPSAKEKLETYCKMVDNPEENKDNVSITYDLTKMSKLQRFLTGSNWRDEDVRYFKEVAYEADGKYAKAIPGPLTKIHWKIKNAIKKANTQSLPEGTETQNDKESKKASNISWKLLGQDLDKYWANVRGESTYMRNVKAGKDMSRRKSENDTHVQENDEDEQSL